MDSKQWQFAEDFLGHLHTERRLSPNTVAAYRRDLVCLRKFCDQQDIPSWGELRVHNLRRYAAMEFASGLSPRSVQRRLSGARMFMKYLIRENHIKSNPVVEVSAPKAPRRLPDTLDADQMSLLVKVRGDEPVDLRDRAIMELLYSSGLRLAELVSLDIGVIDRDDGTVRVLGKGAKERIVPVGRYALKAVSDWLRVRANLAADNQQALFVGTRGKRISPAQCRLWSSVVRWRWGCRNGCTRICSATALQRTCWNPPAICGAYRRCWVTQT